MLRKVTLGLIAATALTLAAAAPAAAGPFHHHHHHGYWGHGWGGVGFGGIYLNTGYGYNDCVQQRWIETRRGMRLRTVNVCAY